MKWNQRAKINLLVNKKHLDNWSSEREAELVKFIFSEFHLESDTSEVHISVKKGEKSSVWLSVALMNDSPSALKVAKTLERKFFEIDIFKRKISFENNELY